VVHLNLKNLIKKAVTASNDAKVMEGSTFNFGGINEDQVVMASNGARQKTNIYSQQNIEIMESLSANKARLDANKARLEFDYQLCTITYIFAYLFILTLLHNDFSTITDGFLFFVLFCCRKMKNTTKNILIPYFLSYLTITI